PALDGRYGLPRYLGVRPLIRGWHAHVDVVRQSHNARDTLCRGFGVALVAVAANESSECDDTILHRYGDIRRIESGLPMKLLTDVLFNVFVGSHGVISEVVGRCIEIKA